jgi:hypothetical protein
MGRNAEARDLDPDTWSAKAGSLGPVIPEL